MAVKKRVLKKKHLSASSTFVTKTHFDKTIKAFRAEMATKEDLKRFATKEDLKRFATKEDLKAYATKEDLKAYATKKDLQVFKDEIIRHFDVVAENIHHDLVGLLKDRVSILQDADKKLDQRVTIVERQVGINGSL